MRATILLCALIAASPAALPLTPAQAEIKPLPKPSQITSGTASSGRSVLAPLSKPAPPARVRPARASIPARRAAPAAARRGAPATVRRQVLTLGRGNGGRTPAPAGSQGGRRPPPLPALPPAPKPTPLALVGLADMLPSSSRQWPTWALVLLGSLAAGEAFLLLRLMRPRAFRPV